MYDLVLAVCFFENIEEPHELRVIDELSEERDLPHRGVVDPIRHILQSQSQVKRKRKGYSLQRGMSSWQRPDL